jgi:hypothetical protein
MSRQGLADAAFARACTACTIDISPMPLPIEMFCLKIFSTMSELTVAISDAGRPDSVLSRIAARALAEIPDGFSTAKYSLIVPSSSFCAQT